MGNYDKNRGERESIKIGRLLLGFARTSGCVCVTLGSFFRKLPTLVSLSSLSLPHVVSFFLSLSPSYLPQLSGICPRGAAGGAERCKVHFCSPVRACVGPGGANRKDQDSSIVPSHSSQ